MRTNNWLRIFKVKLTGACKWHSSSIDVITKTCDNICSMTLDLTVTVDAYLSGSYMLVHVDASWKLNALE